MWDSWDLIEEYNSSNVRTAAYLQGAQGVIKSLLNNIYYYQDKLGSTTHIANASGQLLESFHYDLYGKPAETSANGVVNLYAGERWVSELGLYDLRNRFCPPNWAASSKRTRSASKGTRAICIAIATTTSQTSAIRWGWRIPRSGLPIC